MSFTDYEEERLLRLAYGNVAYTPPSMYYFGVSSTPINDAGTGGTEPSGANYSRVAVPNGTLNFLYSGGQIVNGTPVQFPSPSADWGDIGYLLISDATSGGNIRQAGSLTPQQYISAGQAIRFEIGDIIITLD